MGEGSRVVVKTRLKFRLLSATEIAGGHLLALNLKNVGSSVLKNLVVRVHSPDSESSVDCAGCFIYVIMPKADETVKLRVPSLERVCFSVCGYASGDSYFSIKSPTISIQAQGPRENRVLIT